MPIEHDIDNCPNCSMRITFCRMCGMPFNHGYKIGWCDENCYDWNQLMSREDFQKKKKPLDEVWEVWYRSRYPVEDYERIPSFWMSV